MAYVKPVDDSSSSMELGVIALKVMLLEQQDAAQHVEKDLILLEDTVSVRRIISKFLPTNA